MTKHHSLGQFPFWPAQALANLAAPGLWVSTAEQMFEAGRGEGGLRYLSLVTGLPQKRVVELINLTKEEIDKGAAQSFSPEKFSNANYSPNLEREISSSSPAP